MQNISRKRPKIGDVVEIVIPNGLAYAQYTQQHSAPPHYGALIRVVPGVFSEQPIDYSRLVQLPPQFMTFFPLGAACNRKIVSIVAHEEIPGHAASFPIFRNSHRDKKGTRIGPWLLWNGEREWKVESLTTAQLSDYPPLGVINDTLLAERIVSGWRHENDK